MFFIPTRSARSLAKNCEGCTEPVTASLCSRECGLPLEPDVIQPCDRLAGSWNREISGGRLTRHGTGHRRSRWYAEDAKRSKVAGTLLNPRPQVRDHALGGGETLPTTFELARAARPGARGLLPPPRSPRGRTYRPDPPRVLPN